MISIFYKKLILIVLFSYILFFHIKDEDYQKMILLSIITGIISFSMNLYADGGHLGHNPGGKPFNAFMI